uniref:RNA-directed DNA polymerase, eukaryota n=1 Tax=Tanacetum cinerariifolium TaxID=118510 RepID=A0A6L2LAJ6_TANCI|nr:RNA-directed DNA polymerase, eukaryota [Tanacetum cinerariifolium]
MLQLSTPNNNMECFFIDMLLKDYVVDKTVSQEQSAFISGRHILDDPLILSGVIDCLGFGIIWRSWIKACLESSRTSVLVNGSRTPEFSVKRGLRQGDPLSPLLFILVMECLNFDLSDVVHSVLIRGIILSNLFYAIDVGTSHPQNRTAAEQ